MVTLVTNKQTKSIPEIQRLPLFGNLLEHSKDRLSLYLRVASECGDVGRFYFGPFPLIQFNTSELVHSVMVEHASDFDKGEVLRGAFRPVTGNGLFTSEGEFHRRQRKLMAPSFQPRHITSYADAMVHYGEKIQQGWKDGTTLEIGHEMTHVTMSIVGKVLFDADVFTEADELGAAMSTVLEHVNNTLSTLFPIPLDWPLPRNWRTKRAVAVLRGRIRQMINERRTSVQERGDFLSILLQAREEDGSGMSDEQITDESLTLFGAGHETTATALTWVWYLLACHPDIYHNVQREVDRVLRGRAPTYADLANLPYTLQVFKETLRLYPPAYAFTRAALRTVKINDYWIPERGIVMVSPYVIHRKTDYFPEPEKFDPERFTPEKEKQLPRYAYIPFGAGPRICIGNHFAMMEGHLLLATLAQRVTFELVPRQDIVPDPSKTITIRPRHGIKMVVRHRETSK